MHFLLSLTKPPVAAAAYPTHPALPSPTPTYTTPHHTTPHHTTPHHTTPHHTTPHHTTPHHTTPHHTTPHHTTPHHTTPHHTTPHHATPRHATPRCMPYTMFLLIFSTFSSFGLCCLGIENCALRTCSATMSSMCLELQSAPVCGGEACAPVLYVCPCCACNPTAPTAVPIP